MERKERFNARRLANISFHRGSFIPAASPSVKPFRQSGPSADPALPPRRFPVYSVKSPSCGTQQKHETFQGDWVKSVKVQYLRDARALYGEGLNYATSGSVGLDLRACPEEESIHIKAGERAGIPVGIAIEPMTPDVAGFVYSRSGLGAVKGLTVAQGVGVIDPDYRGELVVWLLNTSSETMSVSRGERVAQLIFQPVARLLPVEAQELSATERGSGGFGHTGTK